MTNALTLREIGAEFDSLIPALVEAGGEVTPEIAAQLHALGTLEAGKVTAYREVCRRFDSFAEDCRTEAALYAEKARVAANANKRLKEWLKFYMEGRCLTTLAGEGDKIKATIQKNGGPQSVELLASIEALPREWCTITVAPNIDYIRMLADPDGKVRAPDGEVLAELVPRGTHLRFR